MTSNLKNKTINQIMYITIGCVIVLLIICISLFMFWGIKNNTENIELQNANNQSELNIEQASSQIGKNIEEASQYEELQETDTIQVKTGNSSEINEEIQNIDEEKLANNENETNNSEKKVIEETEQIEELQQTTDNNNEDPIFVMPVEGEIVKHYGKEKLIYSDTLKEWTTHLGIDIKADKTTIVKSSSDGCIKSIKNDPRYGLTVVIEHNNGFTTVYSNLLTAEFVVVGENVKSGQTIGTVGNSATFEILDEPHLHFEILKDGNSIDPEMYIK